MGVLADLKPRAARRRPCCTLIAMQLALVTLGVLRLLRPAESDNHLTTWTLPRASVRPNLIRVGFSASVAQVDLAPPGECRLAPGKRKRTLAGPQSDGFFEEIDDCEWRMLQRQVAQHTNHRYPAHAADSLDEPSTWYQENFEPDFGCRHERRIGLLGDGGKWLCDPHRIIAGGRSCLVYSIGSNGDFSFEQGVVETLGCEVHTFDFGDFASDAPPGVHFHQWGLHSGGSTGVQPQQQGTRRWSLFRSAPEEPPPPMKTLQETIEVLGHHGREVDVFKIDCEGCEWEIYRDWISVQQSHGVTLRQVLVEVHGSPAAATPFFTAMQDAGYVTFHKEPNIQWQDKNGWIALEYAFIKLSEDFLKNVKQMGGPRA